MAKTIIGYFEQVSEAQRVLQDLLDHGFDRNQISLIAHQERSGLEAGGARAPHVISVPGVGPVLATGPLAASLSNTTGDPSGSSLLEVLKDSGVPADEAEWYLDALRRGGALVAVETGDADADRVVDIMNRVMQPAQQARARADTAAETSTRGDDMETIERSIDLNVPVHRAYQQWSRFEEFPQFMEGVEEVRRLDAQRLHWVANIGGTRKEWDA
jgi:Polyketide cyclase / dehydrase and lipid transport